MFSKHALDASFVRMEFKQNALLCLLLSHCRESNLAQHRYLLQHRDSLTSTQLVGEKTRQGSKSGCIEVVAVSV